MSCFTETDSSISNYCIFKEIIFNVSLLTLIFQIIFFIIKCCFKHYRMYCRFCNMLENRQIDQVQETQLIRNPRKRKVLNLEKGY